MRGLLRVVVASAGVLLLLTGLAPAVSAQAGGPPTGQAGQSGQILPSAGPPIQDSYIVLLRDTGRAQVPEVAQQLAQTFRGRITHVYSNALTGFAIELPEAAARGLARHPLVELVQQDGVAQALETQANPPSWGLDRIDQRDLPLDSSYNYTASGAGVTAYIIDTGIRITHTDFEGRASIGTDTLNDNRNGDDCNGHGTHVAGTVGGGSHGVAKDVSLVAVRVLNCGGSGSFSGVVAGIDWVAGQPARPAVANMSLGGQGTDVATETAVRNAVNLGITVVVASGNSNADACNFTPAREPTAITVNASTINDSRASFSNFGRCTDIFAPGQNITSAWNSSDTALNTISGTSMASPHVAGAVAVYLQRHPNASPAAVDAALSASASPNRIAGPGTSSPNLLLFQEPLTPMAVHAPSLTVAYGATVPATFTPTYTGLVNGDTAPDTPATCSSTAQTGSAAGTYPITCSGAADSDYEISYVHGILTIDPVPLQVNAPSSSVTYGATVPATFTPTYTGLVNGDTGPDTPPACTSTGQSGSPAGTYPITCSGAVDSNYEISYAGGTLTIGTAALQVNGPSVLLPFGTDVPATFTLTYTGLVSGDTQPATPPTCTSTGQTGSPVGTYPITCSGAADSNYEITYVEGTLTIERAPLQVSGPSLNVTYGATVPDGFTPTYTGLVNGDTGPDTPATCSSTAQTGSPAGTYPITCSGAADPNYEITHVDGTLTVDPAPLQVSAPSLGVTYGATVPDGFTPTYTGLVNGDTGPGTPATCSSTGQTGSAAGSYPITCSGAADPNYEITYIDGTLTVDPAPLQVNGPSLQIPFGEDVPATFTPTYTGLVNGDTQPVTPPTCTSTGQTGSPVGTYPITCNGAADSNYVVSYVNGTLTIGRAPTVLTGSSLVSTGGNPTARLTAAHDGTPISGQEIVFKAGSFTVCKGTTDADGVARCSPFLPITLVDLSAHFAGTDLYLPSSGTVPIRG